MKQELSDEQKTAFEQRQLKLKGIWDNIKSASDLKGQARLESENFEDYKDRRKIEQLWTKSHLRGKYAWLTTNLVWDETLGRYFNQGGGTYRKSIFGELER